MLDASRPSDLHNPNRPALDVARTARALALRVEPVDHGAFRVSNNVEDNYVTLEPYFNCDCGDAVFRDKICKHLIAALLYIGDAEAVAVAQQARELIVAEEEAKKKRQEAKERARELRKRMREEERERKRRDREHRRLAQKAKSRSSASPKHRIVAEVETILKEEGALDDAPPKKPSLPVERIDLSDWW